MMRGYATPEEAVQAQDSVPAKYVRVVAVEYAPTGAHAVVFIAFNEPSRVEPYVVLCEATADGWIERYGGSGGGLSWMSTSDDGSVGVRTTWDPPCAQWDVPAWDETHPDPADERW
jgi:hypothetical protein